VPCCGRLFDPYISNSLPLVENIDMIFNDMQWWQKVVRSEEAWRSKTQRAKAVVGFLGRPSARGFWGAV